MKFILASKSPRRISTLKNIGYDFEVKPANIDESSLMVPPPDTACMKIALKKARAVEGDVVLAADTFVWFNNEILSKPVDNVGAVKMLEALSGKWHEVYTGVAVTSRGQENVFHDVVRTKFRDISSDEIRMYVSAGLAEGKAGGFTLSGYGSTFVENIEGNFYTSQGLPLARVFEALAQFGVLPNPEKSKTWNE